MTGPAPDRSGPAPAGAADEWLLPFGAGPSAAVAPTPLGTVDGTAGAAVDARGFVVPAPGGFGVDWWVGADDRWHLPSGESAARQRLVAGAPVVETTLRIPGGEAVHRVYAVRLSTVDGGGEGLVVEVENRSAVPFALALAIRPFDFDGPVPLADVRLDGVTVRVDGHAALVLPRHPNRAAASTATGGDVRHVVTGGAAHDTTFEPVSCTDGRAHAAVIFPLPHGATFRALVPLGERETSSGLPAVLPGADDVADGWTTQTRRATRYVLPERRVQEAADPLAAGLLLAATTRLPDARDDLALADTGSLSDVVDVARALSELGFDGEAGHLFASLLARPELRDPALLWRGRGRDSDGEARRALIDLVAALSDHHRRTADRALAAAAADLVGAVVSLAAAGQRRTSRRAAGPDEPPESLRGLLLDGALLLAAGREPLAAADALALADRLEPPRQLAPDVEPAGRLRAALVGRSATGTWPDAAASARFASLLRASLLRESEDGVELLPSFPDAWLGQGVEVHHAPTRFGSLSFALRWHGDRPALLWEVDAAPGSPDAQRPPLRLTCPGLDPSWSTGDRRSEALLAPVPIPAAGPSDRDDPGAGGVVISGLQIGVRPPPQDGHHERSASDPAPAPEDDQP